MRPGIIIERDGILNRVRPAHPVPMGPTTLKELELNTEALNPLARLKAVDFVLVATTNQPGLSSGMICRSELERIHQRIQQYFQLDDILVCPHSVEDRCPCRKPAPGLITEALFKWRLRVSRTYVISDKWQDAAAADYAGCISLLVKSPWCGNGHHDFMLPTLQAVVDKILALEASMASREGMVDVAPERRQLAELAV
jgi:D-glycero-D-manno-heptose 1,7-bisphosphate phosphatase